MDSKEFRGLMEAYSEVYAPQEEIEEAEKWIQKAIKKPGALHKQLGVPEGEKIPSSKLASAAKKGGKLGQRARLAQTLKGLKEEEVVDEGYQRDPEGAEKKKTHSKQPDPSKPGFTGIGNMSIDQIRKMSARIEKENTKKEEVDIFDTVLEYLVAEGYADNNQEALKIMANLSEEEILEYKKLAAGLVGGMMALNMMKPGVAPTGIKRQAPEPDKTELVSKADKEKKTQKSADKLIYTRSLELIRLEELDL